MTNTPTPRAELLFKAIAAIARRGESYGPPGEHFQRTCDAAYAILPDLWQRKPTPEDWAKMMICDKLARDAEKPKDDNCTDLAGYAACLYEVRHPPTNVSASCEVGGADLTDLQWMEAE